MYQYKILSIQHKPVSEAPSNDTLLTGTAEVEYRDGFMLTGRSEAWGVAVQEAAVAWSSLVCSDAVGSAVHLFYDGCNFSNENPQELNQCMKRLTVLSEKEREIMSLHSKSLCGIYSSELWVKTSANGVETLKHDILSKHDSLFSNKESKLR